MRQNVNRIFLIVSAFLPRELTRTLKTLYAILSPSPDLRDYVEDFGLLSILYQIVRNAFRKKTGFFGDIAKKTKQLVSEKVKTYGLETTTPAVKIDETTLKALKDSKASTNIKVINLINNIIKTATAEGDESPYLKPIGERAGSHSGGLRRPANNIS